MKFVEKNGRVWPSKKMYECYRKKSSWVLWTSLQLECYSDDTDDKDLYEDEGFKILSNIRRNLKDMSSQELFTNYDLVIERFNKILDRIGRDKFTFYNDGSVEYIWKYKIK